MLLPAILLTLLHSSACSPDPSIEYNHKSSLLIFCASIDTRSLVVGMSMAKSAISRLPCLNKRKNPVLALPAPAPSFLYTNPN